MNRLIQDQSLRLLTQGSIKVGSEAVWTDPTQKLIARGLGVEFYTKGFLKSLVATSAVIVWNWSDDDLPIYRHRASMGVIHRPRMVGYLWRGNSIGLPARKNQDIRTLALRESECEEEKEGASLGSCCPRVWGGTMIGLGTRNGLLEWKWKTISMMYIRD